MQHNGEVSTHSRPKAAGRLRIHSRAAVGVSTHSRPKAAGLDHIAASRGLSSFNTQPPEGGWLWRFFWLSQTREFQHTAARRRLGPNEMPFTFFGKVSTHSRPKAAGWDAGRKIYTSMVSTHSRPKAAGGHCRLRSREIMFQHTAARRRLAPDWQRQFYDVEFQHTAPPEGGWRRYGGTQYAQEEFQHTAARRRLGYLLQAGIAPVGVSTHSRPKAAGMRLIISPCATPWFQHTAARRRLVRGKNFQHLKILFQHTAARRRLAFKSLGVGTAG